MISRKEILNQAKLNKNDEFYTRFQDVENELVHYDLKNKVVYCPCDNRSSEFWNYLYKNFDKLQLKELHISSLDNWHVSVCKNKVIKSEKINGDFRSEDCLKLFNACDVVITNPPFSLFKDFFKIVKNKQYLICCSTVQLSYKDTFEDLKRGNASVGYTQFRKYKNTTRESFTNWLTNLNVIKNKLKLECSYDDCERSLVYCKDNGYNPNTLYVNVDKTKNIPYDYFDLMLVPVSFLTKYKIEQFELIDILHHVFDNTSHTQKFKRVLIRQRKH